MPIRGLPAHTHTHTHTHGLVELLPWSWPGGSHRATTPLPGAVLGQQARFWPQVHIAVVEGQHRDAPLACTVGLL